MISISRLKECDLLFLNTLRNLCRNNLHDNTEYSYQQTVEWFRKTNPEFYIIKLKDESIGYIRTSIVNGELYVGMDIVPEKRGKGLGTRVYRKYLTELFSQKDIISVFLEVLDFNLNAIHLYEKLGFKSIDIKSHNRNGEILKSIKMKLSKEDYNHGTD